MTIARRRTLIRRQRSSVGLTLAAAVSFLAGMTDAIGLLSVGDFVSFMSGNTTYASVAIADGDFSRAALLSAGLAAFVLGNAGGVIVSARSRPYAVFLAVCVLLSITAMPFQPPEARFLLLSLSMGIVNASVEQIEGLPIGLTYVTGALSRFGRGLGRWLMGEKSIRWVIQIVPWSGMLAGAVAGAILQRQTGGLALWAPAAVALVLGFAASRVPRRWERRFADR